MSEINSFVSEYYLYIIIAVVALLIVNVAIIVFTTIRNKKNNTKVQKSREETRIEKLSEEERSRYIDKIKFLEERVKEQETEISHYVSEFNDAKLSTLNLTKTIEELQQQGQKTLEEDEDYEEEEDTVQIVDVQNVVDVDDSDVVVDKVEETQEVKEPEKTIVEVSSTEVTVSEEENVSGEVLEEKLKEVETEADFVSEIPVEVLELKKAIYNRLMHISQQYKAIDENTSLEEKKRINAELEKAKMHLEQYKKIESKYNNK